MRCGLARWGRLALAVIALACGMTLAGCRDREQPKVTGLLRIPYVNEYSFQIQYGDYFGVKFPDLAVEVIPTTDLWDQVRQSGKSYPELFADWVEKEHPDLIITDSATYEKLAERQLLYDLGPLVKKGRYDLNSFVPAAVELLKQKGGGKLYGLAPHFTGSALYFNKDLFDKYGVPYPHDQMTWEDVMRLAARFPADEDGDGHVYGYHEMYRTPFDIVNEMAQTNGLTYVSADGTQMTIDTDPWRQMFRMAIDGFKRGTLYYVWNDGKPIQYGPEETTSMDLFRQGKAAMTVAGTDQIYRMRVWRNELNWDVVTAPTSPANPDRSLWFDVSDVFAIGAQASNIEAAWRVMEYFTGEEAARTEQKISDALSTRAAFAKDKDGHSLAAFYRLLPADPQPMLNVPRGFAQSFEAIAIREIDAAVRGGKSADDAVRAIQAAGQEALATANAAAGGRAN